MSNRRRIMYDKIATIIQVIDAEHKSKKKTAEVLGALNKRKSL